ncbi:phosphate acyltransferase PlsX, partial [Pseudomonas aeruginosa]
EADVVVGDGFVVNILRKPNEGLAAMVSARIEQRFRDGLAAKLVGALALPLLHRLRGDIAPARYNGASCRGLQGIVVKSHGSAA